MEDASAVLASANIPKSLVKQTAADIGALVESSGVTQQDVETIVGDVQTILTDLGSLRR